MRNIIENPLKLGILGCGVFAINRILPILKEIDTVRVVCIQNQNQVKADKIAHQFNIPRAVSTREALLADIEVEAVHITTPNFMHEEDALACAKAGKPTLCEKPLSTSLASVNQMIKQFEEKSIPFFVGHQMRFNPAFQKMKELVESGEFGKLLQIRAYYYSRPLPNGNWRLELGKGGGALQEIGVHLIDLIHYIFGEEIVDVRALSTSAEVDRMISIQGRLSGGSLVSIECAFERPYYNGLEVIGTKARLVSCDSMRQISEPIESLYLVKETGERINFPISPSNVYVEEYKHFANAVIHGVPSPIEAKISCLNQKVIDRAYDSLNKENV